MIKTQIYIKYHDKTFNGLPFRDVKDFKQFTKTKNGEKNGIVEVKRYDNYTIDIEFNTGNVLMIRNGGR